MTKKTIRLSIKHPSLPDGLIQGFRFFWAYYVNGFQPEFHCQPCFTGKLVEQFCTGRVQNGHTYQLDAMDRYPYVYICGVGSGPKKTLAEKNLHLPLQYKPDEIVSASTYNGYILTAEHAVAVPIPALPDGWSGRDRETARCKNFRFGVAYFGSDAKLSNPDETFAIAQTCPPPFLSD